MAETGPIFSMPPASSSSTLEKICRRMLSRARAAALYSSSPLSSCIKKVKSAAKTALPAVASAVWGWKRSPRNPAMISASAVVPIRVRNPTPAMARIQGHEPRASFIRVLFSKSMACPPFWSFPALFSVKNGGKPAVFRRKSEKCGCVCGQTVVS